MRKIFFFIIVLTSLSCTCVLQVHAAIGFSPDEIQKSVDNSSSKDTADSKKSLLVEIDYGTNRGYQLKRKTAGGDSSQKYISPNINYEANSGFFANMGFYKTPGAKKSWDEFYFGLGYDFTISKSADVDGSVGYTHYTYREAIKKNSVNPSTSDLTAYVKHDFDVVALKVTGDYYFGGTNSDEDLIIDLDHDFYLDNLLSKKDELSIDPTFTTIAATQNYYKGSIQVPDVANPSQKQMDAIAITKSTLNNLNQFNFVDYEFYLPVNYQIGKFDMEIAWHYNIPANLLPANLPPNVSALFAPVLNAKPYSYITALISWDFLK